MISIKAEIGDAKFEASADLLGPDQIMHNGEQRRILGRYFEDWCKAVGKKPEEEKPIEPVEPSKTPGTPSL